MEKKMVYVVEDVTTNGVYDLFCSFCKSSAEQFALLHRTKQLTERELKLTDTSILGWEIETDCDDPQMALSEFADAELEEKAFIRDADYWKEVK